MNAYHSYILITCLVMAWGGCNPPKTAIPDTVREGLQGPVKRALWQREVDTGIDNLQYKKALHPFKELYYDRDGYKSQLKKYELFQSHNINKTPNVEYMENYFYNRQGYKIRTDIFSSNWQHPRYFYQFRRQDGSIYHEVYEDHEGNLIRKWIVERDENNQVDIATVKDATGTVSGVGHWYYDEQGWYIQKGNPVKSDVVFSTIYNASGTILFDQQISLGLKREVTEIYSTQFEDTGKKQYRWTWDILNNQKKLNVYDYIADDYGNWTSEAEYSLFKRNGKELKNLFGYTFRDIEYYED